MVTLEEMKQYLRVDSADEDALILEMIENAKALCQDVARLSDEEMLEQSHKVKVAVLYAVAYFYEHREEADHHALTISLRSLLFGVRKEGF